MGAQRWLNIGPISFQPSEVFKIVFIIILSRHLAMRKTPFTIGGILKLFFFVFLLPFLLILKQPDLGTGIVLMMIFLSLILSKGIKRKTMLFVLLLGLISIPFIGNILWDGLKDYQKNRLIAFMEPEADPKGIGYQIIQSRVAVGSGMLFGKGYLRGTQGPFKFLPEKHTDFIFSSFAEEWGFFGCLIVLCAYLLLILRALDIAKHSKDSFGRYLAMGVAFMFTTYSVVNLAMILGLMPIVGVPLPFMSYGGTALIINFMAVGILMGIRARRFYLFY
jgi:rod shape determining protein RodA